MIEEFYYFTCNFCDFTTKVFSELKTHVNSIHFPENYEVPQNVSRHVPAPDSQNKGIGNAREPGSSAPRPYDSTPTASGVSEARKSLLSYRRPGPKSENKSASGTQIDVGNELSTPTAESTNFVERTTDVSVSVSTPGGNVKTVPGSIHSCSECDFKSKDIRKVELHNKIEHLKTLTGIKCEHCDYVTPLNANMRVHTKKHRKCSHCDYISKNLPDLKKHTKGVHGFDFEENNPEPMEQDVTDYPDGTGKSIKKSGAAKEPSCPRCDVKEKSNSDLLAHINSVHQNDPDIHQLLNSVRTKERTQINPGQSDNLNRPGAQQLKKCVNCNYRSFSSREMAEHVMLECVQQRQQQQHHHSTQQFGHHQQQQQPYDQEGVPHPFYPSQQQHQHYQQHQQFEHHGASHQYQNQQYQEEPQFGQQEGVSQQFNQSQVNFLQHGENYPPPQGPDMHPHQQYDSAFYDQRQIGIHQQQQHQQQQEPENLHLCSKCDFTSETAVDMAMHSVHEHGNNN